MGAVRFLLGTHALLWWLFDDPHLSGPARDAVRDPENAVLVSSASVWEIATKHRLSKLPEAGAVVMDLPALPRRARLDVLPISLERALAAGALRGPHRDPFDRMLIAQSRLEGLPVIMTDPVFGAYGVDVLW